MQKKALVVAMGAALVMQGAFAQKKPEPDSVVVLYGKVYPEFYIPDSKDATASGVATCTICTPAAGENAVVKRTMIESSNSRFGIRGHEKLAPNLKAIFQLETQFLADQNNTPFARRDAFVGLAGGWGTVKLGRMDTPFKQYGDDVSFLGVSSGNFTSTSTTYRHIGMGGQANAARFHERRANAVTYESPDIGPAEFKVQYSTNEAKTATRDPYVWSFGGQLEFGNFAILLGHEIHKDLFGLSANVPSSMRNTNDQSVRSEDRATAIAFKYKWGKHEFEIDANEKKYEETGTNVTGRVRSYKNNAYMFIWDAKWTPQWRTAFHYVKATKGECSRVNAACNTDGLAASQISAGVAYHFSRRTYLFLMYSMVKNDHSARFNPTADDDVNPGEDVRQVGLGIHTSF
jgi:general bacterial porin, GBP family